VGSVDSRTWPPFRDPRHILQGRPGRGLIRSAPGARAPPAFHRNVCWRNRIDPRARAVGINAARTTGPPAIVTAGWGQGQRVTRGSHLPLHHRRGSAAIHGRSRSMRDQNAHIPHARKVGFPGSR
jgi:hypothetical protein